LYVSFKFYLQRKYTHFIVLKNFKKINLLPMNLLKTNVGCPKI
jgi:hypothetical protein